MTHTCPEQLQQAWHTVERPAEEADIDPCAAQSKAANNDTAAVHR
jgi:hypothetical protein